MYVGINNNVNSIIHRGVDRKMVILTYIDKLDNTLLQGSLLFIIWFYLIISVLMPFAFLAIGSMIGAMISIFHLGIIAYLIAKYEDI